MSFDALTNVLVRGGAGATLDLSGATSPLFSLGSNATFTVQGIAIQGANLAVPSPGSWSLPPSLLLQLRAIQTRSPGALLRLQDVQISTPSCAGLSLHQAALCASAPSPNFTITPGFLWISRWSTPSLVAENVTVTCAGAASPQPCVAVVASTGQDVVNAIALLQAPALNPAAPMYIWVANDVSLANTLVPMCGSAVAAEGSTIPASAFGPPAAVEDHQASNRSCFAPIRAIGRLTPPLPIALGLIVISGGNAVPPRIASALSANGSQLNGSNAVPGGRAGNDSAARPPVLDLGGATAFLDAKTGEGRVEVHNATLTGLSLSLPDRYPLGLLRGLLWAFSAPLLAFGALRNRVLAKNVEMRLEPGEVAVWASSAKLQGRPPASPAQDLGFGTPCAQWYSFNQLEGHLVPAGEAGQPPASLLITAFAARSNTVTFANVLLAPSAPADYAARPCGFPLWPGCAADALSNTSSVDAMQPTAAGAELSPGPDAVGYSPTAPEAVPAVCRLQPEGEPAEAAQILQVSPNDDAILAAWELYSGIALLYASREWETPLRLVLRMDAALADVPSLPRSNDLWADVQANVSQPATILGDPAGPRLLNLSARPALINLRAPLASLTLRDLVLVAAPTAGLHPAALTMLAAAAVTGGAAKPESTGGSLSPTGAAAPGTDPTGGLAPGLANFTSCLWTLDFDRRPAAASAVDPPPAPNAAPPPPPPLDSPIWWPLLQDRPAGLPRAFLDGVLLLVPRSELLLLAWCAAHNSTALLTDPWVVPQLAAMAARSELLRPDLVREALAAEAAGASRLTSITFWRLRWCGLQGRNVTLAAQLPYAAAAPYVVAAAAAPPLALPVDWGLAMAGPPPGPSPASGSAGNGIGPSSPSGYPAGPPPPGAAEGSGSGSGSAPTSPPRGPGASPPASPYRLPPPAAQPPRPPGPRPGLEAGGSTGDVTTGGTSDALASPRTHDVDRIVASSVAAAVTASLAACACAYLTRRRCGQRAAALAARKHTAAVPPTEQSGSDDAACHMPCARAAHAGGEGGGGAGLPAGWAGGPALPAVGVLMDGADVRVSPRGAPRARPALALARMHARIRELQDHVFPARCPTDASDPDVDFPPGRNKSLSSGPGLTGTSELCGSGGAGSVEAGRSTGGVFSPLTGSQPQVLSPQPSQPSRPARRAGLPPAARSDGATTALTLLGELGRGAQGVVYAGRWRGLDVAVKSVLLHPHYRRAGRSSELGGSQGASVPEDSGTVGTSTSFMQAAVHEAAIAASLSHPNIVACYTFELRPLHAGPLAPGHPPGPSMSSGPTSQGSCAHTGDTTTRTTDEPAGPSSTREPEAWRLTMILEQCNAGSLRSFLQADAGAAAPAAAPAMTPARPEAAAAANLAAAGSGSGLRSDVAAGSEEADNSPVACPACGGSGLGGEGSSGRATSGLPQPPQPAPAPPPGLPSALAVRLALDVARGMSYLHSRGVAHGDLSSSNVLLHEARGGQAGGRGAAPVPPPRAPAPPDEANNPWWAATLSATLGLTSSFSLPATLDSSFSLPPAPNSDFSARLRGAARTHSAASPTTPQPQQGSQAGAPQPPTEEGVKVEEDPALPPWPPEPRLTAKVCDFGLSHRLRGDWAETGPTHVTGPQRRSSLYSAPELVRDGHSGYKQDVYAFGVLLWELAAGLPLPELLARPAGRAAREWLRGQAAPGARVEALPPGLLVWPDGTHPHVQALAEACLRVQPAARPEFKDIAAALKRLVVAMSRQ